MYVCLSAECSPLQTAGKPDDAWRRVSTSNVRPGLRVYVIYFQTHCAAVTPMSPRDNLSPPLWRYIAVVGVRDIAAPAIKTTDLFRYSFSRFSMQGVVSDWIESSVSSAATFYLLLVTRQMSSNRWSAHAIHYSPPIPSFADTDLPTYKYPHWVS